MRPFGLALLVILAPGATQAHLVGREFGAFYAGSLHLLVTPEHVAILLVLAMLGGLRPREHARWALLGLPLGFVLGTLAATVLPETWAETGSGVPMNLVLGLSLTVAGLLAALALPLRALAIAGLAAVVAALHGYANMLPAVGAGQFWLYSLGVIATGTVTGTLLIAVFSALSGRAAWIPLAYRVVAGWVVAIGTMYAGVSAVA